MISSHLILTLKFKDNEQIQVYSDDNLLSINHYSYTTVIFNKDNKLYPILSDFPFPLYHFLLKLQDLLNKSLSYNFKLDASISDNIGYLWNRWINDNDISLLYIIDKNNYTSWIGKQYELSSGMYISWIYNDQKNNIIFEVTPAYPLGSIDQNNDEEIKKYMIWMKNYKSLFKTIIPRKTAQQWLAQATQILTTIDENS